MPYTRQEEEKPMTDLPRNTDDIPGNVPAEALEEILEFERAQWEEERADLNSRLEAMGKISKVLDEFVLSTTMNLGGMLSAIKADEIDPEDAITNFFANFLDQMPTPSKLDLQEHLDDDHQFTNELAYDARAMANYLTNLGYDPEAIVEEAKQADSDFIQTILGGMRSGFDQQMSADFDDEPQG